MIATDYDKFLAKKIVQKEDIGFDDVWIPDWAFPFQGDIVRWGVQQGYGAIFADCGLGKTPMSLIWSANMEEKLQGTGLILTPLAVSVQFITEGKKFGIDVHNARQSVKPNAINVINYEQLHKLNPSDFKYLVCDESGILKNYDGTRRKQITEFCHRIPNKLLGSATPAPNDYTELGSSSEALEVMERDSMLGRFFSHSGKTTQEWELKGHSRKAYWRWVATWARAIRKPSDFGYDDGKFVLPPIDVTTHTIESNRKGRGFFNWAMDMKSQRKEKRNTIDARCRLIADMIPTGKPSIVWCDLNDEGDLLEKLIPNAVQVSGKDSDDVKEKKLLQFTDGTVEHLVTKAKIGGFGMNWQHCADVFCFPTHSFESHYQKIRRCYRFGQKNTVKVRIILTEAEKMVLDNMLQKEKLAIEMFDGIIREMQAFQMPAKTIETNLSVKVPSWL